MVRGRVRPSTVVALTSVVALLAVACSSTAPATDPGPPTAVNGAAESTSQAGPQRSGEPPPSPGNPRAPGSLAGPGGSGTGGTAGPAAPGSVDLGPPGPGVSATAVRIGFWIIEFAGQCASFGMSGGEDCEDADRDEIRAINRWINDHGGVAGRTLDEVIRVSTISSSTYAAEAQASCEFFTTDEPVLAVVLAPQPDRGDFVHCLARHGVPVINAGAWPYDGEELRTLEGFLYQPDRARPERWVRAYIDGLHAQGFFGDGRIGLVRFDAAPFTRVTERVLKPRLARHGLALTEEALITTPQTTSAGYGTMSNDINNAILRFQSAGVDRVLFFGTQGEFEFLWFPAAEAQGYRPRYGLSSPSWPGFMEGWTQPEQLRGAMGVGWMPGYDVAALRDPGGSRAATRCKKILEGAGLPAGAGRNPKCDNAFFLKAVLDRGQVLNATGIRRAVGALGGRFRAGATFSTHFGPSRFDGPTAVRYLVFDESCPCFRYRGGLRPMQ